MTPLLLATPDGATCSTHGEQRLPLIISAATARADLAAWSAANVGWIADQLKAGALLFRGFAIDSLESFAASVDAIAPGEHAFKEESSPRTRLVHGVYTSTDYNPRYPIQFHNEYSYSAEWPMKLFFGCLVAPAAGGQTPLADSRRVLGRLSESTRARFGEQGVLYVRNYTGMLGVRWQDGFATEDPLVVEAQCRALGIEVSWRGEEQLQTRQRSGAVVVHPSTGEQVWFNHGFFFNVQAIEPLELREALLATCSEDELSTQTYFGDGSPIPLEMIEEIREAYRLETQSFPWRAGDVLLIDNMLCAHSRSPFEGARRIVVAMRDRCRRADL